MQFEIEYAGNCLKGPVRAKNEDNLNINGKYLAEEHSETEAFAGSCRPGGPGVVMAVFDGIGGLPAGEIASCFAAKAVNERRKRPLWTGRGMRRYVNELFFDVDQKICKYAARNRIGTMGTTAALMLFGRKHIAAANLGDSSIYKVSGGRLTKISRDHVLSGVGLGKPPLTQFLGQGISETAITPHVTIEDYEEKAQYLLCTDGVTDLLTEYMIEKILKKECSLSEKVEWMKRGILNRGAADNATMILIQPH